MLPTCFSDGLPAAQVNRFVEAYNNPKRPIAWGEADHRCVAIIQSMLLLLGYSLPKSGRINPATGISEVDGNFGWETFDAVRAFQRANGIGFDGAVGHNTMDKLCPLFHAKYPGSGVFGMWRGGIFGNPWPSKRTILPPLG
jgi:hypothetical protein